MSELNEAPLGPSTDEAMVEATPEVDTLDDDLRAIYRGEQNEAKPEPEVAETDTPEPVEGEAPEPEIQVPTDLPSSLRDHWGKIPEEAREIIAASQREMAQKTAAATREVKAYEPIKESLVEAIKANPAIANMRPEEVAKQVPEIIRIGQKMSADPVNTILTLAQQHNVLDHVAQALTGQNAPQGGNASREIAELKQEIQRLRDPSWIREQYESWNVETMTLRQIEEFSSGVENWAEVENYLPQTIPLAKSILGDSAPAKAVLEKAHEIALQTFMPDKARAKAVSPEDTQEPDPVKVQKAKDAKSVNVKAQAPDKPRPQKLDDELRSIYRKSMAQGM